MKKMLFGALGAFLVLVAIGGVSSTTRRAGDGTTAAAGGMALAIEAVFIFVVATFGVRCLLAATKDWRTKRGFVLPTVPGSAARTRSSSDRPTFDPSNYKSLAQRVREARARRAA